MGDRIAKLVERNRSGHHGSFLYEDPDWLRSAYHERGLTLRAMAVEAECGMRTIARWMETHGVPTDRARIGSNPRSGPDHPRWRGGSFCDTCGEPCTRGCRECNDCRDRSGDHNPKWRGDRIGYEALHDRIVATRGKASNYACAHCSQAAAEWAYDNSDPNELHNPSGRRDSGAFSLDINRYLPLCSSCHKRFDVAARRVRKASALP